MIEYVYPCGTTVKTIYGINGIITCYSVRFDSVIYEISYNTGEVIQTTWVREQEFKADQPKEKIGYKY